MFHTALRTAGRRAASALLVRAAAPSRRTAPLAAQLASRTLVPRAATLSTSRVMRFPDDADDAFAWQERIYYPPSTLQVGKPAPTFSNVPAVIDGEISELSLSDYRGQWVVLFFYPKDFTFVCPTEIIAFSDRAAEFEKLGAQVIACSADSAETHLAWIRTPRKQGGLGLMQIPIVADFTKDICNNYGVLLTDIGVPLRGLFIINPEGVVEQATINNLPVGRSVDETLRLLTAFQYTAEHGEVCPANWKPGEKTMIADPDASMEYFKTVEDPTTSDADARVKVVSTTDELKSAVNQSTPTVAYVRAEWCGKCEQIRPFVEKLSKEYTNVNFVKIDADSGAAAGMNVEVLPSFHFYKGGKEVSQPVTGFKKKMLEEAIKGL